METLLFWPYVTGRKGVIQVRNEQFIGTWKLVSCETRSSNGEVVYPYGMNPYGMLMYDSEGNMSVLLMRRDRPKFASGDLRRGTTEEIKAAFEGFNAYCGTYDVNEEKGTITHHVEGSKFPNRIGADLIRFFKFLGDQLHLSTSTMLADGKQVATRLVWTRTRR